MPHSDNTSVWNALSAAGRLSERAIWSLDATINLDDLAKGSSLGGRLEECRGRSVLVATKDQVTAALALIELDGIARRIVLCPPDLPSEHVPRIMATAAVDVVVTDQYATDSENVPTFVVCGPKILCVDIVRKEQCRTEWVLLTSGTTGLPKMVTHTFATLTGAINGSATRQDPVIWSTFYDIRRYGGLQILLRALLGGGSLVLSNDKESTGNFLIRAGKHGVTHVLGTPTHWWLALTSSFAHHLAPEYIRLSGEIVDQTILDHLRAVYPGAAIVHAFASTEAGVGFEIRDGLAGFPASLVGQQGLEVDIKVEDGTLRIRSARNAACYLDTPTEAFSDADGFVDTRDIVELRGSRYYFIGRRDGVINVGGQKVHPEEIEAVINSHSLVRMSLVRGKKSPITGSLVVADVVLNENPDSTTEHSKELKEEILRLCRVTLPRYKVPTSINFVPSLAVSPTGKIARRNA
jgi:acyl-coenzyme A synthetase/AMP-(fatty) acid ligase